MNILFISISCISDVSGHSISMDLMRELKKQGHQIYILCALEINNPQQIQVTNEGGFRVVRAKIGGNKKVNIIEKGITTLKEPYIYIDAIKEYINDIKFDLVLYPTPPITQVKAVKYIKKRDNASSYLLLKDIFPQNAVDIGMMKKSGISGLLYRYFRKVEKELYKISDAIGCMSQANIDYLLKHNPEVDPNKVEIFPNCIEPIDISIDAESTANIRKKFGVPEDKKIFVYGGNLGKPQGIPFIIKCMERVSSIDGAFFIIVGDGTEYKCLEDYINTSKQSNLKLMKKIPKNDYYELVASCDVGLIFLDHRFTIPNFPSRLLNYLQAKIPVLACTDPNTDIGTTITQGNFGWWCESNDIESFYNTVQQVLVMDTREKGINGFNYLVENFSADKNVSKITRITQ